MSNLQAAEFEQFFGELHQREPFPWQTRLAIQVCEKGWPKVIDLPTASGKTACIDIALFALAVRGSEAPRRIFFVVDRRVIVSEAYKRADRIKNALESARVGILKRVAEELGALSGDDTPLCIYELRGGAFRDETWVRSPRQPAVIASTVDQVGSRLLFRGYAVAESTWPIHAGLIANDSIIFLDEAHCSKAFAQTLGAVERYRSETWASKSLKRRFHFVEMSATPTRAVENSKERFTIDVKDRENQVMRSRLSASKPTHLPEPVKCRKDEFGKFAQVLIDEAIAHADEVDAKRIAIMVNRICTAKEVHSRLCRREFDSALVIGRMRPLDRDDIAENWEPLKSGVVREAQAIRRFIVSTQCLEVGADLDFDVVVSECASIDALQQRFGRLDRVGDFGNARGAVIAASWQLSGKDGDPVYGEALCRTWDFLQKHQASGIVDFGIEGTEARTIAEHLSELDPTDRSKLTLTSKDAPMLLPAHLDALVQTGPQPEPEPLVEYFLHGPDRGSPDVYVVWRADMTGQNSDTWAGIVALCPPSSSEAMPVPLWIFRKWLQGKASKDESDSEIVAQTDTEVTDSGKQPVLVWKGPDNSFVSWSAHEIHAGAMVVLPSSAEAWNDLGFKPKDCWVDRGDEARLLLRRRISLRLHPNLIKQWKPTPSLLELETLVSREDSDPDEIWEALEGSNAQEWQKVATYFRKDDLNRYPVGSGWILESYYPKNRKSRRSKVLLQDHLDHVAEAVESITGDLIATAVKQAVKTSAKYHDYGKADLRYQAWLRNGDAMAARYAPSPIAKSGKSVLRKQTECGLPENFRHELLSFLFAANATDLEPETRDLVLHLVASHHGHCRPFGPLAFDEHPDCVRFGGANICGRDIIENPPFSLKWGIADRFWKLTREYGWWGLAYLEAMLRLADWRASDEEGTEVSE